MDRTEEARLERLLPLRGDERVLEVGTETGLLASALASRAREVVSFKSDQGPTALPFGAAEFDVVGSLWTIHRTRRPELLVAELTRVTKLGGTILVVDQVAPVDPLAALELNNAARTRDPSTTRVLAEGDLRALFDANNLLLRREEVVRQAADVEVGWFVLTR